MTDSFPKIEPAAPIRLGIVLPAGAVPAWIAATITGIRAAGDAEVVLAIRVAERPGQPAGSTTPGGPGRAGRAVLGLVRRLDRRAFGRPGDPTEPIDPEPALDGLAVFRPGRDWAREPLVDRLRAAELDVLLRFGRSDLDPLGRGIARHGVWSIEPAAATNIAPGLAEVLAGTVVTVGRLVARLDGPAPELLGWTASATDRVSHARGMRGHLAKVAPLAARALRDLRLDGGLPVAPALGADPEPAVPAGAARLAASLLRLGLGYAARLIGRTIAPDRWILAVAGPSPDAPRPDALLPDPARRPLRHLLPPPGRGWADPFLVRSGEETLLFVEEWVDAERRGRIALVRLDSSGRPAPSEPVLALPGHLSYPQVFEWHGSWYLLPEQAASGGLELYRATSFPTAWTHDRTLIDEPPLADATLAEIDGRWWLFAAARAPGGTSADELLLFSADGPLGPWTAHRRNPVLSDIRAARPAGRLVRRDGRWYRPSQDGSVSYGWALNLNRIDRLDDDGYGETRVAQLQPNWDRDIVGTHTLAELDGLTVIDLSVRWPRIPGPWAGRHRRWPA